MWYCCVFILILQKTAKSGKNGEVWRSSRGSRHSWRGLHHALKRPQTRRSSAYSEAQTRESHHSWCGSRRPIPETNQIRKQRLNEGKVGQNGYIMDFLLQRKDLGLFCVFEKKRQKLRVWTWRLAWRRSREAKKTKVFFTDLLCSSGFVMNNLFINCFICFLIMSE
jgi:hypothetical protein